MTGKIAGLAPNVRGAMWMLASAIGFTAMTTLIKFLGEGYPAPVQTFYRQAAGMIILLPWIARDWRGAFRTSRPGIVLYRSAVATLAMILAFYAYQELPLADANALSFTRSLWLVPLAGFVLREAIGPARIGATVVGFLGVLLMLKSLADAPGHALFGWPQAAALASAFLFATTITGMKVLTRDHSAFVLLVWSAALGLLFSIPPAVLTWRWPDAADLALLTAMGVIGTATQACYIRGMKVGEAAAMAPIDYTRLVFAVIAGFILFREVPGLLTLAGAGIVVASTLFITWREQRLARAKAPAAPEVVEG